MAGSVLPIGLQIEGQPTLVVGGGVVAARKAQWLLESGAGVRVVSPHFCGEFEQLANRFPSALSLSLEAYAGGNLSAYAVVIAATGDQAVNRQVAGDARRSRTPVNVVDDPYLSTFFVPATLRRGPLGIAIFTDGNAPALAARIRTELEDAYPAWYAVYVAALGAVRRWLRARCPDPARRRSLLGRLADREVAESLAALSPPDMEARMKSLAKRLLDS